MQFSSLKLFTHYIYSFYRLSKFDGKTVSLFSSLKWRSYRWEVVRATFAFVGRFPESCTHLPRNSRLSRLPHPPSPCEPDSFSCSLPLPPGHPGTKQPFLRSQSSGLSIPFPGFSLYGSGCGSPCPPFFSILVSVLLYKEVSKKCFSSFALER